MSTLLIVLVIATSVVVFFLLRSGENLRFEAPTDPHRVLMAAVGIVGAKRCWETMAQSDRGARFKYHKGPNMLIALILLLWFVVPGVVYIVLCRKRESLVVNIDPATTGMTVVQVTSNGFRGKGAGRELRRQVSVSAGALGSRTEPALTMD